VTEDQERAVSDGGEPLVARAVDDRRLARLQMAAALILQRGDAHTPLERQWAREVFDLAAALRALRDADGGATE